MTPEITFILYPFSTQHIHWNNGPASSVSMSVYNGLCHGTINQNHTTFRTLYAVQSLKQKTLKDPWRTHQYDGAALWAASVFHLNVCLFI